MPRVVVALINRASGDDWPADVDDTQADDEEQRKEQIQLALSDLNRDLQVRYTVIARNC